MIAAMWLIAVALTAEASPEPKSKEPAPSGRDAAIARLRGALPKGWTLELTGLPSGVEAIALGPQGKEGRAVLIATRLSDPNTPIDRASLEARLGTPIVSFEQRGILGATEVRSELSNDGTEFVVLHLLGAPVAPYALSLIAPKRDFLPVYKTLASAAERLAIPSKVVSEKVGTRR